jgi:hypothetical protein
LFRVVPHLLILAAVVYGWIEILQRQQAAYDLSKVARLRAAIGLYERLSPIELNALWELAQSNNAVRDSFLVQALEHPATAEQFNRRADMAVQAVVGLDPDTREKVFHDVVSPCLARPPPDLSIKVACINVGIALSMAGGNPDFSIFAVGTLIEAMERTTDPGLLEALAGALKAVPGSVDRQTLINLLKWPTSVGVLRSTLLDMLEKQTYQKFDGKLWKMVTWAQANGLDVKSPPKRPNK